MVVHIFLSLTQRVSLKGIKILKLMNCKESVILANIHQNLPKFHIPNRNAFVERQSFRIWSTFGIESSQKYYSIIQMLLSTVKICLENMFTSGKWSFN